MKLLRILLVITLVIVTCLYGFSTVSLQLQGTHIGPSLTCSSDTLDISVNDFNEETLLQGITAQDQQDGDITGHILVSGISKMVNHTVRVTYVVFDSDHNMASLVRSVHFTDYVSPKFQLREPLSYSVDDSIALLDRLWVEDVIDGDITGSIRISDPAATDIADIFTIDFQVTNSMGDTVRQTLPILRTELTQRGKIVLDTYLLYLDRDARFNAKDHLVRLETGRETQEVSAVKISGTVDTSTPGTYHVHYSYYQDGYNLLTILTVVVV